MKKIWLALLLLAPAVNGATDMKMRTLALLLLVACPAWASPGVDSILGADGKLDPKRLDDFVSWVEPSIREYPPRFKDKNHQDQVVDATQRVVKELLNTDTSEIKDQRTITNVAHVLVSCPCNGA